MAEGDPAQSAETLDERLRALGYELLGGMANRVYLHPEHRRILKVAVSEVPVPFRYRLAGFRACREASSRYAGAGIMPEVLEAGGSYLGLGFPYLEERYIPGRNLSEAYLDDAPHWDERLPRELARIYGMLLGAGEQSVSGFWDEKLAWLERLRDSSRLGRFKELRVALVDAACFLRETCPSGFFLHGDLQLANLLVPRDELEGRMLMLLDWELYAVYPVCFEFAHFWANLYNPVPQVETPYQDAYARIRPLRCLWTKLLPVLNAELNLDNRQLRNAILVHRIGWLQALDDALATGRDAVAEALEQNLEELVSGAAFEVLPIPV